MLLIVLPSWVQWSYPRRAFRWHFWQSNFPLQTEQPGTPQVEPQPLQPGFFFILNSPLQNFGVRPIFRAARLMPSMFTRLNQNKPRSANSLTGLQSSCCDLLCFNWPEGGDVALELAAVHDAEPVAGIFFDVAPKLVLQLAY